MLCHLTLCFEGLLSVCVCVCTVVTNVYVHIKTLKESEHKFYF